MALRPRPALSPGSRSAPCTCTWLVCGSSRPPSSACKHKTCAAVGAVVGGCLLWPTRRMAHLEQGFTEVSAMGPSPWPSAPNTVTVRHWSSAHGCRPDTTMLGLPASAAARSGRGAASVRGVRAHGACRQPAARAHLKRVMVMGGWLCAAMRRFRSTRLASLASSIWKPSACRQQHIRSERRSRVCAYGPGALCSAQCARAARTRPTQSQFHL